MKRRIISAMVVLVALASLQCKNVSKDGDSVSVDFSMVEEGVGWLDLIASGAGDSEVEDYFMRRVAPTGGCKSIIRHWKRFMKWNNDEFFTFIMEALGRVETDREVRDENGELTSFGRRQVMWQEAVGDPARIRNDLEELRAAALIDTSLALAKAYLPKEAVINSKFFIVLFGGSSAYAVGDVNGFDLLQLPRLPGNSIDIESVIGTFAHEMHHTGVSYCQKRHMSGVRNTERLVLAGCIANEGMPICFINRVKERLAALSASSNPTQQADARDWKEHLSRLPEIYKEAERDIGRNLDGEIGSEEVMGTWMAGSQGPAYVLGSDMFSVIDENLGLEAALEVANDYRQLLEVYNRAAKIANQNHGDLYVFDEGLSRRLAGFTGR